MRPPFNLLPRQYIFGFFEMTITGPADRRFFPENVVQLHSAGFSG
jgi:hypothetical protein